MKRNELIAILFGIILLAGGLYYIFSFVGLPDVEVTSFGIIDDGGFPVWSSKLNTSGYVVMRMYDPEQDQIFEEGLYSGVHLVNVSLASFRSSPTPGQYEISLVDHRGRRVWSDVFEIEKTDLEIVSMNPWWMTDGTGYRLVGFEVMVKNKGITPRYPSVIQGAFLGVGYTGWNIPCTLSSGMTGSCYLSVMPKRIVESGEQYALSYDAFDHTPSLLVKGASSSPVKTIVDPEVFSWEYRGNPYEVTLPDLSTLYQYFSGLERLKTKDYSAYCYNRVDDAVMSYLSSELDDFFSEGDLPAQVNGISSFVHDCIQYEPDNCTIDSAEDGECEYPKYPVQTLVQRTGDCEDTAILMADILWRCGANVSLLRLPGHMAVGVVVPEGVPGYEPYIGEYYYLETTGNGGTLGWIPPEYRSESNITIYVMEPHPVATHWWKEAKKYTPSDGELPYADLSIIVDNLGWDDLEGAVLMIGFEREGDDIFTPSASVQIPTVGIMSERVVYLTATVPSLDKWRLVTRIVVDGKIISEKRSADLF